MSTRRSYAPQDNPTLTIRQLNALRRLDEERERWATEHPDATTGEKRANTNRYFKALRAEGIDPKTRTSSPEARQRAGIWDTPGQGELEVGEGNPLPEPKPKLFQPWLEDQAEAEAEEVEAEVLPDGGERDAGAWAFADKYAALACAQALYKELGRVVGTKDPTNLRGACDADLKVAFESDAPEARKDRQPIAIGGVEVGRLSVVRAKAQERDELVVESADAYERWAAENGFARATMAVSFDPAIRNPVAVEAKLREVFGGAAVSLSLEVDAAAVMRHVAKTGEMPEGARIEHVSEPERFKNTTIAVDAAKVFEQLAKVGLPSAGGIVAALESATEKE